MTRQHPDRYGVKCVVCGRGFSAKEWVERHTVHDPEHWSGDPLKADVHAQHCPDCHNERAEKIAIRRSHDES